MFTGIIESLGTVEALERHADSARLVLRAEGVAEDLPEGGSLAVNGVCLTAVRPVGAEGRFVADVMGETLHRTGIGALAPGARVNLERCLPAGGRFDGHIVQGHVDGTGAILALEEHADWTTVRVGIPAGLAPQLAEKGSIALDGISLTVTAVSPAGDPQPWFEVGIIPATLRATTLGGARVGDAVNLETDAVAKYLLRARQFEGLPADPGLLADAVPGAEGVADPAAAGSIPSASLSASAAIAAGADPAAGADRPRPRAPRSRPTPSRSFPPRPPSRPRTPPAPWTPCMRRSARSPPAGSSSWSTTRTARTRATSSARPPSPTPSAWA
ncbi:riboflavin synthase [Rothia sp. AR01]|uniref:Riboflavin synthase n=1 Tax=Rothia santali TaxID=2949643 RepID=A0A9X2HK33_9MICC|nr:riboflavin synthase [Rothia santali]MCP3425743.1 riboflavin synthase [Rothia santali]